jgi:hypothetical protein
MESRTSRHNIREFVDSLHPGSRVVWIANGAMGTIQPDKTILWDDGHHMTHKHMNDSHALLIHSEAERTLLQDALNRRLNCLKSGCTLVRWDPANCTNGVPERLCPLALISEPESPSVIDRRKRHLKSARPAQAS